MKSFLLLPLLFQILYAQDAVVYRVPDKDAVEGKRLFEESQKAKVAFEKWKDKQEKSLQEHDNVVPLKFSLDFRLAVPDTTKTFIRADYNCLSPVAN